MFDDPARAVLAPSYSWWYAGEGLAAVATTDRWSKEVLVCFFWARWRAAAADFAFVDLLLLREIFLEVTYRCFKR
jgi:hypothetical protein